MTTTQAPYENHYQYNLHVGLTTLAGREITSAELAEWENRMLTRFSGWTRIIGNGGYKVESGAVKRELAGVYSIVAIKTSEDRT